MGSLDDGATDNLETKSNKIIMRSWRDEGEDDQQQSRRKWGRRKERGDDGPGLILNEKATTNK